MKALRRTLVYLPKCSNCGEVPVFDDVVKYRGELVKVYKCPKCGKVSFRNADPERTVNFLEKFFMESVEYCVVLSTAVYLGIKSLVFPFFSHTDVLLAGIALDGGFGWDFLAILANSTGGYLPEVGADIRWKLKYG